MSLLFLLLSAAVVFAGITVRKAAPWFRLAVLLVVCADVYTFAYGYMPYVSTKKDLPAQSNFCAPVGGGGAIPNCSTGIFVRHQHTDDLWTA